MNIPENYITVDESNKLFDREEKPLAQVPPTETENNLRDRSIENFLNDRCNTYDTHKVEDFVNDKVTQNGDIATKDDKSLPLTINEVDDVINDDIFNESVMLENELQPIGVSIRSSQSDNIFAHKSDHSTVSTRDSDSVHRTIDVNDTFRDTSVNNNRHVATPTITTRPRPTNQTGTGFPPSYKNLGEFELFSMKLNELTTTIHQKDDEIRKLSEKLVALESKKEKSKKKSSTSSSSSSSTDESVIIKEEIKVKKNKEQKQSKTKDSKLKQKKEKDKKPKNECKVENSETPLDEINKIKDATVDVTVIKTDALLIPDLRQKLIDLEQEINRLRQANADAIFSIKHIENKSPTYDKSTNETLINQLLVDHSLLKEELDQLKWEHSKLAEPSELDTDVKQLKLDVNSLRNQNELLHQYLNSSSPKGLDRSCNHNVSKGSFEKLDEKVQVPHRHDQRIINDNNNSNFISKNLHAKRRTTSTTPTVPTMLKNSIESLESPYRATSQSIQYAAPPYRGGETYRTRRLSDSTSVLVEDPNPKVWLEPVSVICKPMYHRRDNSSEITQRRPYNSVHSFESDTPSTTGNETETETEDNYYVKTPRQDKMELLSSVDSESIQDSTYRANNERTPKYSYSFTPKSALDLTLDDLVKFARPGGKLSTGRVCFVGPLPGRREVCVGLELDEDAGKHDGVFEGFRYFQCKRNRGVFISFHKIILAYKSL